MRVHAFQGRPNLHGDSRSRKAPAASAFTHSMLGYFCASVKVLGQQELVVSISMRSSFWINLWNGTGTYLGVLMPQ